MTPSQGDNLPRGCWSVLGPVLQEPGRWRAWAAPKGNSELRAFDASTREGARQLAQSPCDRENAKTEGETDGDDDA